MIEYLRNLIVQGPSKREVSNALLTLGRSVTITPMVNGYVVVFDYDLNNGVTDHAELSQELSRVLHCSILDVEIHDSIDLAFWLMQDGVERDYYNAEEDEEADVRITGGQADVLCEAFGKPEQRIQVNTVLHVNQYDDAVERFLDLAEALDMPKQFVLIEQ